MINSVSIITASYNSAKFLDSTIQSVLSQTHTNWEMIIVDDCSTDDSLAMAMRYAHGDKRIKVIAQDRNSGAAIARNIAIAASSGRFIAFLDSDDLWHPRKLEKQISFMLRNRIAFSYTSYEKVDETGKVFQKLEAPHRVKYKDLLKTCSIGCLTAIYDSDQIGKVYMPTNTKREDYATWLHILKSIDFAYGLREPLGQYRVYQSQSSSKKLKMAKENWLLYRNVEKLNLLQSCYYFTHYAVRGLLKQKFPRTARILRTS